jgi:phospholipid/cholesterol/gamma-HCH transport system substrate-binding protein
VVATLEIRQTQPIPADSRILISKAILGETTVAVIPGTSSTSAVNGAVLQAASAVDPLELVQRMEGRVTDTLSAFETTGQEWRQVAVNLNSLMETHEGNLGVVIENAARSLSAFTASMESAQQLLSDTQRVVADPQIQQSLKQTLVALPEMVRETRSTILASRQAIQQMEKNLANLSSLTEPLAQRGPAIATKLDSSLNNLDLLLTELSRFGRLLNEENGTLHKLAADPELYDNLNRSAQSLTLVLRNVEPMLGDLREFSDKIARNPELLGVGGAVRPSGGLRDNELLEPERVTPVSGRSGPVPRR